MSIKQKIFNIRKSLACARQIPEIKSQMTYESKRNFLIEHILCDSKPGITTKKYTSHNIIVSLTTYGRRINDVAFTIESLMQQTIKANKIILWLDNRFKGMPLPQSLINQQSRGLDIYFCKDIRSYTKLVPTLCKYPDDAIITVDDDLLYEYDLLERLINAYIQQPQYIHACRVHKMTTTSENVLKPYGQWIYCYNSTGVDRFNFLTGCGGVLYPPNSLDEEVLNEHIFMNICKYADDVWFNAMAIKKGTLINKIVTRNLNGEDFVLNNGVQDMGLFNVNAKGRSLNDSQVEAVFTRYNLYSKLTE